jgi:hypothetical protein
MVRSTVQVVQTVQMVQTVRAQKAGSRKLKDRNVSIDWNDWNDLNVWNPRKARYYVRDARNSSMAWLNSSGFSAIGK